MNFFQVRVRVTTLSLKWSRQWLEFLFWKDYTMKNRSLLSDFHHYRDKSNYSYWKFYLCILFGFLLYSLNLQLAFFFFFLKKKKKREEEYKSSFFFFFFSLFKFL